MPRIERSALAEEDLLGIWAYIAADNPNAADAQLRTIEEKLRLLALSPLLGEEQPDLPGHPRRFVIGSYLIFYRPLADGIEVARIFHGARRYEDLL
jgi:toxin ParE1/3/4